MCCPVSVKFLVCQAVRVVLSFLRHPTRAKANLIKVKQSLFNLFK